VPRSTCRRCPGLGTSHRIRVQRAKIPDTYEVGSNRDVRPVAGAFAGVCNHPGGRLERIRRPLCDPAGGLHVPTVGRLDPVKDQLGLIKAFCQLRQQLPEWRERLRLVLVGEGSQRKVLEAKIASAGLVAQVQLLGNRTDVAALLGEFDIFALSSIAEGMPGAVLEAMASGLPIVATRVGGVGEVVVDGVTGTLVEPSNPTALAQALRGYVENESRRRQHGHAGRERVEQHFSLHAMLAGYTSLYDEVLAKRDPASPSKVSIGFAERRER